MYYYNDIHLYEEFRVITKNLNVDKQIQSINRNQKPSKSNCMALINLTSLLFCNNYIIARKLTYSSSKCIPVRMLF